MELYLKKYFWVLHLVVIAIAVTIVARAVNHVIEGKYLLAVEAKAPARRRPPRPAPVSRPAPSKDGQAVAARNMFCSSCEPPKPPEAKSDSPAGDPNAPVPTSLPLALVATSVARDATFSSATLMNTQNHKSGSYGLNDEIPGAGPIVKITARYVDFRNKAAGNRLERIDLLGAAPPAAPSPPSSLPTASSTPAASGDDFAAELDRGVRKLSDTQYEIDRALVDKVLGDPALIARSARIVPSIKDGKANGFKMYAIRPNSVYAKIGLQNGDTIHAVNNFEITSPDKALEVYTKVKSATSLSVQVTRRGKPITLDYRIK